ncbi:MAG TPA: transporter [Phycisphaerae bacterium]|nr:transporter [Phycisphaerae bacterium]
MGSCVFITSALCLATAGQTSQPSGEAAATDAPARNILGLDAEPLTGPLVTDRPDFTESTSTIPYGHLQLEGGYTFSYDSGDGERNMDHTYPEMLARIGLVKNVELRIAWLGWSHSSQMHRERSEEGRYLKLTDFENGPTDMNLGFKFHLLDQKEWIPDFGVIVDASIPVGAQNKTSGDVDPTVKWLWAYDLGHDFAISGNVNFAVPTSENGRFFQAASSISLSHAFTDRLGGYVEYFGFYPNDRGQSDAHYTNGGLTFLVTDNFQLDIRAGVGLNDEADDFFTGIGFAYRW